MITAFILGRRNLIHFSGCKNTTTKNHKVEEQHKPQQQLLQLQLHHFHQQHFNHLFNKHLVHSLQLSLQIALLLFKNYNSSNNESTRYTYTTKLVFGAIDLLEYNGCLIYRKARILEPLCWVSYFGAHMTTVFVVFLLVSMPFATPSPSTANPSKTK